MKKLVICLSIFMLTLFAMSAKSWAIGFDQNDFGGGDAQYSSLENNADFSTANSDNPEMGGSGMRGYCCRGSNMRYNDRTTCSLNCGLGCNVCE